MDTKTELRKYYKTRRANLEPDQEKALNKGIFENLKRLDWRNVNYCHIFLPILKFHEPDTFPFIQYINRTFPEINIVVSQSDLQTNLMRHFIYDDQMVFETNKWGILEPLKGREVDVSNLDRILIPLLISDEKGNRVGYGKGFYDRFLSTCKPEAEKVGLSFFRPIAQISDVDPYDIPLDICITADEIYHYIN